MLTQGVKLTGVATYNSIDKYAKIGYTLSMVNITNIIKAKYYRYQPGEFMPIYIDGSLANKRQFHAYKAKRAVWMIQNYRLVFNYLTHQNG